MGLVGRLFLRVIHFFYSLSLAIWSIRSRYFRPTPKPLTATRSKIPSHLALVLVSQGSDSRISDAQEAFLSCTEKAIACCRAAGIQRLSVYDRQGILLESLDQINERLEKFLPPTQDQLFPSEAIFPLTPPLSDDSDAPGGCHYKGKSSIKTIHAGGMADKPRKSSRIRPRIQRHRTQGHSSETFTLHLVSPDTGKPTIAAVADSLVRKAANGLRRNAVPVAADAELFKISVSDLQDILEGDRGYGPPDLMIVHNVAVPKRQSAPLELHSFPPWQVRLTEIHYDGYSGLRDRWMRSKLFNRTKTFIMLSELDFRRALDEYSSAEFRLGK